LTRDFLGCAEADTRRLRQDLATAQRQAAAQQADAERLKTALAEQKQRASAGQQEVKTKLTEAHGEVRTLRERNAALQAEAEAASAHVATLSSM